MAKYEEYQTFVVIVEAGSLVAAARELHLSASAVSKKLGLLEQRLGVQLIDRSTRSLTVTDLGDQFYSDCKKILALVDQTESKLQDAREDTLGKLRVSIPRVLLQPWFIHLLQSFKRDYPHIRLHLSVSDKIEDLIEGNLDFVFRIGTLKDSRLKAIALAETRAVFCASPDYLNKQGQPRDLNALAEHSVVLPTYINVIDRLRQLVPGVSQFGLEQFDTADDAFAVLQMVKQGFGITMMLDLMVEADFASGQLVRLLPQLSFPSQDICLLWNQKDYQPRKMTVFKEFMKAHFLNQMQSNSLQGSRRQEDVLGQAPRLLPLSVAELDEDLMAMVDSMISVTQAIDARGKELLTDFKEEASAEHVTVDIRDHLANLPEIMLTMLRHPDLFRCQTEIGVQLLGNGALTARERELVILRIAWLCQAPYEWGEHVHVGKSVGLTSEDIQRIISGPMDAAWGEQDRALLQAVDELYADAMICDDTWNVLRNHLNDKQLIELPILIGQYQTVAYYQNSLRLRLHDGNPGLVAR